MKAWSKKKKWLIGGMTIIAGLIVLMIPWPRGPKTLASLPYLDEISGPEKIPGCFTIKNTGTNEIIISLGGVDTWFGGEWNPQRAVSTNANVPMNILPGKTTVLWFDPPSGAARWRGRIYLHQSPERLQYWAARGRFLWNEAMTGFPNRAGWNNGVMFTTPSVVTREIVP